jgi:uncharacterized protein YjiS (DUF1127 family)
MRTYLKNVFRKAALKREYESMLQLSDRRLEDLGLTRYDVVQLLSATRDGR